MALIGTVELLSIKLCVMVVLADTFCVAEAVNAAARASGSPTLVNLASDEYFKAVGARRVDVPFVQPVFEDWSKGTYKVVSFYAKRARGLMARYAVQARLDEYDEAGHGGAEGQIDRPAAGQRRDLAGDPSDRNDEQHARADHPSHTRTPYEVT